MIRTLLLWLFVGGVVVYAWKDWYKALCGLVLMMAVVQHPDMPKSVLGIPGLNPWNFALCSVVAAWWHARRQEGLTWDVPRHVSVMFGLYMLVAFVAFLRMMGDASILNSMGEGPGYLIGEHLVNVFKWVVPGILFLDGCRSRERFRLAIFSVLAVYVLLAVQVIRWVPLEYAMSGETLAERSHKIIGNEIGYHRVNMSMMLAGASWAIFVSRAAVGNFFLRFALLAASFTVLFGQSLTAGRAGYVTWAVVGLALCLIRWKRYLVFAPVVAAAVLTFVPGVSERLLQGFSEETRDSNRLIEDMPRTERVELEGGGVQPDLYTVTSGRTFAWPFVLEQIAKGPWFGFGKEAMIRTGITTHLYLEYREIFPHPHNAYLELLLDNGIVGFLCVIPFYLFLVYTAFSLFRDSRSPIFVAIGGITAALMLALLIAAFGSQTFYPREGSVGMWCAIGLMLRVAIERRKLVAVHTEQAPVTADVRGRFPRAHHRPSTVRPHSTWRRGRGKPDLDDFLWRSAA